MRRETRLLEAASERLDDPAAELRERFGERVARGRYDELLDTRCADGAARGRGDSRIG